MCRHYYGVNVQPDVCLACHYHGELINTNETENDYKCPNCGNEDKTKMSVVRRVCGYTTELALRKTSDNKMKEIKYIFYMTGLLMILFVLIMAIVLLFSDNNYSSNKFVTSLVIAIIGFASITIGASCRTNK